MILDWTERLNRGPGRVALGQETVELLNWAHQQHLPDNRPHRHTYFEVCLVGRHGEGLFFVEGREYQLTPGTVFFARPGGVHQIVNTAVPGMELFWTCFQWTPAAAHANGEVDQLIRAFADATVVVSPDHDGRLAAQWHALQSVAGGVPRSGSEAQIELLVRSLLIAVVQIGAGADAGSAWILGEKSHADDATARLAVRYIHDNLNRPLHTAEIAGQVYTSPRHLSRLFQRFTGTSPALYIVRARLDRAKGLLVHTQVPIKEIAEVIGMPDVHHFTRVFSQQIGCPPGEFRRAAMRPVPNIQKPGDLV